MPYTIIQNSEKLVQFIDWLPELAAHERFYVCLFARKKYCPEQMLSTDKVQLKRFLSKKEDLYYKIQQLSVEVGAYRAKKGHVPQAALAVYINPNPRNLHTATYDSIIRLTELLKKGNKNYNPQAEVMSCIQRSKSRNIYLDFDIDTKKVNFQQLANVIDPSCLSIVETRGGFHVLVKVADILPEYKKSFFKNIVALGVDQTGDQLLPIPGCVQGGFMPRFIHPFGNLPLV